MQIKKICILSTIAFLLITGITHKEIYSAHVDKNKLSISKKLRRILSAEMNAVQNGITNLAIAIPAGKWNDVVEIAQKMKKTYIFKKKLSKKQLDEFNRSVPLGYKDIDGEFYSSADQMSKAALEHNLKQVNLYFYKLMESCVKCHFSYASHRFPGFNLLQ
jgi:hypothetical protein